MQCLQSCRVISIFSVRFVKEILTRATDSFCPSFDRFSDLFQFFNIRITHPLRAHVRVHKQHITPPNINRYRYMSIWRSTTINNLTNFYFPNCRVRGMFKDEKKKLIGILTQIELSVIIIYRIVYYLICCIQFFFHELSL